MPPSHHRASDHRTDRRRVAFCRSQGGVLVPVPRCSSAGPAGQLGRPPPGPRAPVAWPRPGSRPRCICPRPAVAARQPSRPPGFRGRGRGASADAPAAARTLGLGRGVLPSLHLGPVRWWGAGSAGAPVWHPAAYLFRRPGPGLGRRVPVRPPAAPCCRCRTSTGPSVTALPPAWPPAAPPPLPAPATRACRCVRPVRRRPCSAVRGPPTCVPAAVPPAGTGRALGHCSAAASALRAPPGRSRPGAAGAGCRLRAVTPPGHPWAGRGVGGVAVSRPFALERHARGRKPRSHLRYVGRRVDRLRAQPVITVMTLIAEESKSLVWLRDRSDLLRRGLGHAQQSVHAVTGAVRED